MRVAKALAPFAYPAFLAAVIAAPMPWYGIFARAFASPETFAAWLDSFPAPRELSFVAVQAFRSIAFVIPGRVPLEAGGFIFGPTLGAFLSFAGIALGSAVNFAAGRALGRAFAAPLAGGRLLAQLDGVSGARRANAGLFLLFALPGLPKDALCHAAGMSRVPFLAFLPVSLLGRAHGIIGATLTGAGATEATMSAFTMTAAIASAAAFAALYLIKTGKKSAAGMNPPSEGEAP